MNKYQLVKLGQLTKIKTGKLDANASSEEGIYPFFTCSKEPLKISNYSYDCECVLVAGNGDLNVKYHNGKFDAYQRTYIIESLDKEKLFVPYLYVFLDKYIEKLREQAIGGVIKYIKLNNLTDTIIPLPQINEQKKIAETLNRVTELILKEFNLIVPPINFQNQFANFVQQVEKLKSKVQKSLDKSQLLFDSLIQQYFE